MLRRVAIALMAICIALPSAASAQSAPTPSAPAPKPAVKPQAQKPRAAKPSAPTAANSGPCDMGVISHVGDVFAVQKLGVTVFNNEYAEVPVTWGFDDLIYARARAAGGPGVRRIAFAKDAFDNLDKPKLFFLREEREKLPAVIRAIAGSSGCRRYLVVPRGMAKVSGSSETLTGIGIFYRTSLFSQVSVFGYLNMLLLDGTTFETVRDPNFNAERVMSRMAESLVKMPGLHEVDKSLYPEVAADAAKNTALRDVVRRTLTEQLDRDMAGYFKAAAQ